MEALLSLAFDNISSRDLSKIRKGIKQIEGLLAQICLSQGSARSPHKRKSSALSEPQRQGSPKLLGELKHDPAFREFFRLQEGFQWNVASRLIATLECLLGWGSPSQTDLLILAALELLQGILLLHPPSRCLFARETYMNLLLDLLDASNPPRIQSQTLLVLVAVLLASPANTRTFEAIDGLLTVTSLFKSRATAKDVKMRSMEFFYFYLLPEAPLRPAPRDGGEASMELDGDHDDDEDDHDHRLAAVRSTQEKQRLLGRYLANAAEIAQDVLGSSPFGIGTVT